jgi:hypothetical protein
VERKDTDHFALPVKSIMPGRAMSTLPIVAIIIEPLVAIKKSSETHPACSTCRTKRAMRVSGANEPWWCEEDEQ